MGTCKQRPCAFCRPGRGGVNRTVQREESGIENCRNLNSDVWRWASVTQCFWGFFWLPSCFPRWVCRIFWFISSRVGPVEVIWVSSSPWGRAGGDSIGAKFPLCSSLKFPFEDEGYSEAFPAKNKPSNEARVWRAADVESCLTLRHMSRSAKCDTLHTELLRQVLPLFKGARSVLVVGATV